MFFSDWGFHQVLRIIYCKQLLLLLGFYVYVFMLKPAKIK